MPASIRDVRRRRPGVSSLARTTAQSPDRLIGSGYVGMLVRSFAAGAGPDDVNLVFWRWGNRLPSRIVVIDGQGRLS